MSIQWPRKSIIGYSVVEPRVESREGKGREGKDHGALFVENEEIILDEIKLKCPVRSERKALRFTRLCLVSLPCPYPAPTLPVLRALRFMLHAPMISSKV